VITLSGPEAADDFQPKILLIGRKARARAPLIHGFLKQYVNRYGIITAGLDPAQSVARGVLQIFEREGISASGIETGLLGRAVNENLRLICYVSSSVKYDAPVISAPCEDLTFDLSDPARMIDEGNDPRSTFLQLRDRVKEDVVPDILDEIQSNGT